MLNVNELIEYGGLQILSLLSTVFYIAIFVAIYKACKHTGSRQRYSNQNAHATQMHPAQYKGRVGETRIAIDLARLDSNNYRVINDVMLEVNNRTTQIDHIVVSPYGIFVIETKNYGGTLIGSEYDNYIAHSYGDKQYMIYNPLRQNRYHVRALMQSLGLTDKDLFVPILAISEECNCKITSKAIVVRFSDVLLSIQQYKSRILSDDDVEFLSRKISEMNITSAEERKNHIERVKLLNECPF